MAEFLWIVFSLPTVLFTVPLLLVTVYWLGVMVGALDIDIIDFDLDVGDGLDALDGAAEAAEGGLTAAGGAFDVAEGALSTADGAAEGVVTQPAEALEPSGPSALSRLLGFIGVGAVPMTVLLSLFVFFGWFLTFLGTWALGPLGSTALISAVISAATVAASGLLSLLLTAGASRPMHPLFRTGASRERGSLIGEECVLTTGRVDDRFGQATVDITDADLLVQVRCDVSNHIARGGRALIISFDTVRDAFIVEPVAPRLLTDNAQRDVDASPPRPETSSTSH